MEDKDSVAKMIDSTSSKIQQLQKAFAELESYRAVTLNLKWKELEEHFQGLERSLKSRFKELEDREKMFQNKTRKAREMLEKKEAAVFAKEQASLQRLQKKRDASVFTITNARVKHRKVSSKDFVFNGSQVTPGVFNGSQVTPGVFNGSKGTPSVGEKPLDAASTGAEGNLENVQLSPENGNVGLMSYPELLKLCKEMDAAGLHKFISDNRKNLAAVREEIPLALRAAPNAACLVLDSLEGFYCTEVPSQDAKKDANLLGLRRTSIMLLECLSDFLTNLGSVSNVISKDIKYRAKAVAEEWKPRLDALDMDASNGNSLEAHAFLQLLASFGIASDFNEEELSRLIPMVSRRRQTADLCRCLGLSEKMPGVIEVLVNSGRQIDAVTLAFAFDLTEQFSPIPLLKSYLNDAKKISLPGRSVSTSPTAQIEVNERELFALKAILKCIEEHKLDEQYPMDPIQKRVIQLEKVKTDKKRETEATKPQPKRPCANVVGYSPRVTNNPIDRTSYVRVVDRYPQYMYDRPYLYPGPTENHCAPFLGSATYNVSPNPGTYFANGYQYQATYLH